MELFFILIIWLLLCVGVGVIADSRGRSGFGYFLLSVVLSPLIGLIVVLVTEDLTKKAAQEQQAERDHARRIEEVRAIAAKPAAAVPPAAATAPTRPDSIADELTKLAALRDRGVLTSEEFQAQKTALLRSTQTPEDIAAERARTEAGKPKGTCPNCRTICALDSDFCPKCMASFGAHSLFQLTPIQKL